MDAKWKDKIFKMGAEKGFSAQEIFYLSSKSITLSLYEGQVDHFSSSETLGISYRGILNGKLGYAYTERIDEESIADLVARAYANAGVIESEDAVFLHDGSGTYVEIEHFNPRLSTRTVDEKVAFLKAIESGIMNRDPRINRISKNIYSESEATVQIMNTLGLDVKDRSNWCYVYAIGVAEENGDTRTGMGYDISNDLDQLSTEKIISDTVRDATEKLGAKSVASGVYPIVFKNEIFGTFFSAFSGIFDAERVQKNLSPMKGKLGEKIATSAFTLIDDPHLEGGLSTSSFDSEGFPTKPKAIIESGVLKTYFHNLKTAYKDGVLSTGNASKGSYKGTVGISPSNLIIDNGKLSFDALVAPIEKGVCIEDIQGLHAGLNTISGDFSLQCSGKWIESGKLKGPVSQITVSGNFFELLMNIDALADDRTFTIMASDYIGAPSVRVKALTVSGE